MNRGSMADKVRRLVDVLDFLLDAPNQAATLSEVVLAVDQPLSSTHDLLRAMVASELLAVDAGKRYHTGPALMRLAIRTIDQVDIIATSRPHLDKLVRAVGHDAYLAIRAGDTVSYAARCAGTYRAGLDIKLGEPVPLHASAVGKLFSALQPDLEARVLGGALPALTPRTIVDPDRLTLEFRDIRERGSSISFEETITGIVGFGAPVRDATARLVAAVHVSAFKDNLGEEDIPRIDVAARACALGIQQAMSAATLTEAPA
jgi:DNA-binding IclR family transcriptional regulator